VAVPVKNNHYAPVQTISLRIILIAFRTKC